MTYDIIIRGGKIVDGAGNPWYRGDIGINDGKIAKIRPKIEGDANKVIDASGLVVSPGFIDIHTHTDYILNIFPKVESAIHQGITTSVIGMCGDGLAPVPPDKLDDMKELFINISPIFEQLEITWNTYEQYLEKLDKLRCPDNLVPFVGYNSLRIAGGSGYENRPPTLEELESMKEYLAEAMRAGAFGMSTGLIYAPQVFAKTDELIELAKVLAEFNGLYVSHVRSEGEFMVKAINEAIEIVEKSGCRGGQISHHKAAGFVNWGLSKETLILFEEANARGLSICCDQYPYTRAMSSLVTALPPWARDGNTEEIIKRLKNPDEVKKIKKSVAEGIEGWENWISEDGFDRFYIATAKTEKWNKFVGKRLTDITKTLNKSDDWETFLEILIDEELGVMITSESMGEEDIRRIMTSRYQMFGSDGAGIPILEDFKGFHPRFFGTYPRALGKYVREEKILTLEDAIRRMTSFPAQRLGLRDRGLLREGSWADIVLFDPKTVVDKATYDNPQQFPEGIPFVLVNGVIVIEEGKMRRKYPGKVLRRPT